MRHDRIAPSHLVGAPAGDPSQPPSPLAPLVALVALALLAATIVARCFTNASSLELLDPGAQLLLNALALAALASAALRRALERRCLLLDEPGLLLGAGGVVLLLVLGAARAPHQDLGWRTALEWTALLGLGLAARDAARDPRVTRALLGLLIACVAVGALLGLHDDLVRYPALQRALEQHEPWLERELAMFPADQREGLEWRIKGGGAVGPWLLANLLACAIACVLPLALITTWERAAPSVARTPARRLELLVSALASGALLLGLLRTRSKGGVLAGVGALAVLGLLHPRLAGKPRRRAAAALGGLAALGLLGAAALWARDPEAKGLGQSLSVRLEYWSAGLAMWRDQPVLGHGLNQFRELFGAYKSARAEEALHAHSAPVQLLAETGVVGLLALLGLGWLLLRPGVRALAAPPAQVPDAQPDLLSTPALMGALLLGQLLGWALVAAFGDELGLGGAEALPGGLSGGALLLLSALLLAPWAVLLRPPAPHPLLLPAGLAGLAGFALDGLTDFGLHYAGTLLLALLLAGLAPALAGPRPAPPRAPVGGPLLGLSLLGLTFLVLFRFAGPGLEADVLRAEARAAHQEAYLARQRGEVAAADEALGRAARGLQASLERWPSSAETWRELGAVLEGAAETARVQGAPQEVRARHEAALRALEGAAACNPRSAAIHIELGLLLAEQGELERAFEALDRGLLRYPWHPLYNLQAAEVRAGALPRLGGAERERRRREALLLLDQAEQASRTTRLTLRRLTPAEQARLEATRQLLLAAGGG